jgi:hypothetical protein
MTLARGHVDKQSLTEENIKKLYEGKVVSSGFSNNWLKFCQKW